MTEPVPEQPPEQPPPPPPKLAPLQSDAVAAALAADEAAITPVLVGFVAAVLAYARTSQAILGSPATVAKKIGYYALVYAALSQLAQRSLDRERSWVGPRMAEELWEQQDAGVQAGVDAGLETLARAAKYIAREAREDRRMGGQPGGVSLPGEPYDPNQGTEPSGPSYADPESLALQVVQATKHGATLQAASDAGWTRKTWVDRGDTRVRPNHAFLGAKGYEYHVVPLLEPFVTLDDNKLWYPGDTSAPVHEWMRCRCWLKLSR